MEVKLNKKPILGTTLTLLLVCMLLAGAPTASGQQPPVDLDVLYVGTVDQPRQVSGWRAYDVASCELVMNVYEPLIFFDRDTLVPPPEQGQTDRFIPRLAESLPTKEIITLTLTNISTVNPNSPACSLWTDGNNTYHLKYYIDNVKNTTQPTEPPTGLTESDVVYLEYLVTEEIHPYQVTAITFGATVTMTVERILYYFKIRGTIGPTVPMKFHPWGHRNCTTITTSTLDTADVEYSFEAGLIHDGRGGPQWMFYKPLFDVMNSDPWTDGTLGTGTDADFVQLGRIMDDAVQRNGTHVWFSLAFQFPQIAWFQILSQSWGSIVDKDMAIDYNCWNGTWINATGYPVWKAWRRYPNSLYTPLDQNGPDPYGRPPNPKVPLGSAVMCGTGPYKLTYWNKATAEWIIDKFDAYWRGWIPDPQHPYHVNTTVFQGGLTSAQRKMGFLTGTYDIIAVEREGWAGLIGLPGVVTFGNLLIPALDNVLAFAGRVTSGSPFMPMVGGANMSNVFSYATQAGLHMRKAFAHAISRTALKQMWQNESYTDLATWHIKGLTPNYTHPTLEPYDLNVTALKDHLLTAQFTIGSVTKSAWEWGFTIPLLYPLGDNMSKTINVSFRTLIEPLSGTIHNGIVAGTFSLPVIGLDWSTYLEAMELMYMPVWWPGGKLDDFLDPGEWARPFQHSLDGVPCFQSWNESPMASHSDYLIDVGAKRPSDILRLLMYWEIQEIYHGQVINIPTAQPLGRSFMRHWVQGWYYNPLYPSIYPGIYQSMYFYDIWKGFTGDVNRDGLVDIFDLVAVAIWFGQTVPPAPENVDIVKDGLIDIFDLVAVALDFGKP